MARGFRHSPANSQQKEGTLSTFSTWIQIDLDAIGHNLKQIEAHSESMILPVIKSNAYGHGAPIIAAFLKSKGYSLLGVSSIEEALSILELVQVKLLVLTPPLPSQLPLFIHHDIIPSITSASLLPELSALGTKMKKEIIVHLKVDTGLGRLGVSPQEAFHLATQIQNTPWLKLGGVFTHFAAAFKDRVYTKKQLHILLQLRESFRTQGWNGVLWHAANSAAFLWLQESHLDFVRIGTLLYGQSPLPLDQTWSLQESWECKTRLIQVHTLPKGRSIGYGRGYTTKHPTIVGVIPVGYSHGLEVEPQRGPFNQLKQTLSKVIKGQELIWHGPDSLPIVGRISMGLTCLDLNKKPHLKVGDELKVLMRRVTASNELPRLYYLNNKEHCVFWKHKVYRRGCILTNLNDLFGSESLPDQRFGPAKHNHFDQ